MSNFVVMFPSGTVDASVNPPAYASIEDALSGARFMLSNGATSAWIVDSTGEVLLPADQVRFRLGSIEESNYAVNVQITTDYRPVDHPSAALP